MAHAPHAGVHAKSPFDAAKEKKSLHCELLKHHHVTLLFCPHTKRNLNTQLQFKADCGDSPSGAPVQIQWSKILMHYPSVEKTSSPVKEHFFAPTKFRIPSPLPDRLEKPPRLA
jgi:hypothetical protein